MRMNTEILTERTVQAGKASVVDHMEYAGRVRYLRVNQTIQSGIYLAEDRRYELLFPYLDRITWFLDDHPEVKNVYLIGGGACAFARTFIHKYSDRTLTVAENDPEIIRIAEEFFDLKVTKKEAGDRLKIVIADGMQDLAQSSECYDLIINDAFFAGRSIGRNAKDTAMIRKHLNPKGVYVTNVAAAAAGLHAFTARRYRNTLLKQFGYVRMIIAEPDRDPREKQNILAYASDDDGFIIGLE